MLVKLYPILQVFARRKEEHAESVDRAAGTEKVERTEKQMTRQEWINADRIVMLALVLGVIIAAIIFS